MLLGSSVRKVLRRRASAYRIRARRYRCRNSSELRRMRISFSPWMVSHAVTDMT